jgi:ABC-type branched-subunit amino acid transport system ATPase component
VVLLRVENIQKRFAGLTALMDVSFEIEEGEIVGIIGPNGSGKTTLFNCITKFIQPDGGRIIFNGENIFDYSAHQIALKGITRNFQLVRNFKDLTVMDNMLMFAQEHQERFLIRRLFWVNKVRRYEADARKRAIDIIKFMNLEPLCYDCAETLSGGQQKILSIAQCLMAEPQLLLLDEPTAAINPTLIEEIVKRLVELNRQGQTLLIIEHNIDVVMELCQRVIVLNNGQKIAEGTPQEIRNNDEVIDAYFGG